MRIGLVCPYSLAVPGGVQGHVTGLARTLRGLGHQVRVLALADEDTALPEFVTSAGRAVRIPYNGSVVPLSFGPVCFARTRRWLADHDFDVLHVHEPTSPSVGLLALAMARGPVVATFHGALARSRVLIAVRGMLRPPIEKLAARIAVSPIAQRVLIEQFDREAIEIPNGVDVAGFAQARPLPDYPRPGGTVGFVGRFDEPRKGMPVLLDALRALVPSRPDLRLLVLGPGDPAALRKAAGPRLRSRLEVLGTVDESTKAQALASVDLLCAPNVARESFGVVLAEAMAAGTPVVATDLEAFRRVLNDGRAGLLVPPNNPGALATALAALLDDPPRRAELAAVGFARVAPLDWSVIAPEILSVYYAAAATSRSAKTPQ